MNADHSIKRVIWLRWVSLSLAALWFFTGRCAGADPVGDFFKKVGQSVSKAFQPRPTPNPMEKKARHVSRRSNSRSPTAALASPTPLEQPVVVATEERPAPSVTAPRAVGVPPEKAKGDLPYGIPVPGRQGMVTSPYLPEGSYIDVRAFPPGSAVKDPYTGKIFLVP